MTGLIDTAIGNRDYLNGGQLLYALPHDPDLSRVRVRFRRLTTAPGFWSPDPDVRFEETCRATLIGHAGVRTLHFLMCPELSMRKGGVEPPCQVDVVSLIPGPFVPSQAEADFAGPIWTATILLSKIIGPRPGTGATWLPVFAEGGQEMLSPETRSGRILLTHLQERSGVQSFLIRVDGDDVLRFGVVIASKS
jgi:hypothetical protein